jgi:K+-sensing histidine kinase KdpD
VTLLGTLIAGLGNITNIALLYLLPVMLAAARFGLWTGIASGLISSLAYNFFFIPPLYTFTIEDPQNIITVVVLLAVAIGASHMAGRLRDSPVFAGQRGQKPYACRICAPVDGAWRHWRHCQSAVRGKRGASRSLYRSAHAG